MFTSSEYLSRLALIGAACLVAAVVFSRRRSPNTQPAPAWMNKQLSPDERVPPRSTGEQMDGFGNVTGSRAGRFLQLEAHIRF